MTRPRANAVGILRSRDERRAAEAALDRVELRVDIDRPLGELGLGEKSMVAIARLLSAQAKVLILDEVTAALTRKETDFVLKLVQKVASAGVGIIVVTHRLHEVEEYCSWVTLIRDGRVAYSDRTPSLETIQGLFVTGNQVRRERFLADATSGPTPLVSLSGARATGIGPIDLDLHAGDVCALVGTLSSNLYAIGHLIAGTTTVTQGVRTVRSRSTLRGRVAFVPEDRRALGLLNSLDVSDNASISSMAALSRFGWIRSRAERALVTSKIRELQVEPPDSRMPINSLSGGNQQKVLMARAALSEPDVYVLCEPTRGVDLGTRRAIYDFIDEVRRQGAAVLVITIDPEDALAVADRVGVVDAGRITSMRLARDIQMIDLLEAVS